jgi:hypothetical protein
MMASMRATSSPLVAFNPGTVSKAEHRAAQSWYLPMARTLAGPTPMAKTVGDRVHVSASPMEAEDKVMGFV